MDRVLAWVSRLGIRLGETIERVGYGPRVRERVRSVPYQGPDFTEGGWGRGFQQALEDCESMNPASIEITRSQWSSGPQRWNVALWDGDEGESPSVMGTGKDPAVAMRDASRKYRARLVEQGTFAEWSRP